MLEVLYTKNTKKINTSNYDGKVYCQMFFEDFLKFIKENSFSINEFKVLLALYAILNESNIYGNVLLNLSKKTLSEKSGVDITNIGKIIKKLVEKETGIPIFSVVKLDVIDGKVVIEKTIED